MPIYEFIRKVLKLEKIIYVIIFLNKLIIWMLNKCKVTTILRVKRERERELFSLKDKNIDIVIFVNYKYCTQIYST